MAEPATPKRLLKNNTKLRRSLSKTPPVNVSNLISLQKASYEQFLQADVAAETRRNDLGLQAVFHSVFPIRDFSGSTDPQNARAALQFVSYELEAPKYDVDECREREMTYSAPLKVTVRLVVWEVDAEANKRKLHHMNEEQVYFGDIPLMTENGTFIINGTERVIVSQLHRSPGIFFDETPSKTGGGKAVFSGRIIPNRGSWIDFEFDTKDILHVRIDRRRKLPATVLLRALGYETEELLNYFYQRERYFLDGDTWKKETALDLLNIQTAALDVKDAEGKVIVPAGGKFTTSVQRKMKAAGLIRNARDIVDGREVDVQVAVVPVPHEELFGKVSAYDVVDMESGEILIECNEEIRRENFESAISRGVNEFHALFIDGKFVGSFLRDTLLLDKIVHVEEAILEIYRRLRGQEAPNYHAAQDHFSKLFFDRERYDLSAVGRLKLNHKLGLEYPLDHVTLTRDDIRKVVRYLIDLKNKRSEIEEYDSAGNKVKRVVSVDDIDHLGNRRVRAVGELLENQFRLGLVRMEKAIKEKMSLNEVTDLTPGDLINAKPVTAVVKEFFGSSQLSQFMDQTNPLSEVTHKRRLSALGPGGLTRDRAGFDVRDVHPTHYGRICPIETPEGPNIGLIASLSTHATMNEHGFIETPYLRAEGGKVVSYVQITDAGDVTPAMLQARHPKKGTVLDVQPETIVGAVVRMDELAAANGKLKKKERPAAGTYHVFYLSAWEEDQHVIAEATAIDPRSPDLSLSPELSARIWDKEHEGEPSIVLAETVTLVDVSPSQLVSVAASLIPFLENDDANRALMGSNMQRQAVPLVRTEAPLVGTGMELAVARDSGVTVVAKRSGLVEYVDASRIVVKADTDVVDIGDDVDIYHLTKFQRSNQSTCINQRPVVRRGDRVEKGEVIADGPATETGELALGQNAVVAFMPWQGYNFEDSILISERLVREDYFTSIHIEQFDVSARDTKLGKEEITRDIPNVGEEALAHLDESGIIRIGAYVKAGDILVGKITPKGETQLSPEEKLLRAIFGEKAGDVRDTSFKVPPGVEGTVIGCQIFAREGVEKDQRALEIEAWQVMRLLRDRDERVAKAYESTVRALGALLDGHVAAQPIVDANGAVLLDKGQKLTRSAIGGLRKPVKVWRLTAEGRRILAAYEKSRDGRGVAEEFNRLEVKVRKLLLALSAAGGKDSRSPWGLTRAMLDEEFAGDRDMKDVGAAIASARDRAQALIREEDAWLSVFDRIQVEGADHVLQEKLDERVRQLHTREFGFIQHYGAKEDRLSKGDELAPGVIKMVKVYVAIKRKLSVGDKMAGRHGNKGVVSKVLPIEDMPYLEDGTPVDIVLNPLGVPSRMNVGQILETHLGWAAKGMGESIGRMLEEKYGADALRDYLRRCFAGRWNDELAQFIDTASEEELRLFAAKYRKGLTVATPVFSGANEEEMREALELGGREKGDLDRGVNAGQSILFDGRTGETFANRVTVGVMYMLKLHHLVDDKIHARSIGPYSLVTQQPLGGKAQFGGQRLGEMEVWALEAYGAAYALQEFLTVKSDDVLGRTKMYESIVKGENVLRPGLPESFNVLVKELQALALDVDTVPSIGATAPAADVGGLPRAKLH